VKDKGVYLVEAVHGELRAYTILMVSDLVLITKGTNGRTVNIVVDRKTGQPMPDVRVDFLARNESLGDAITNGDGIVEWKPPSGPPLISESSRANERRFRRQLLARSAVRLGTGRMDRLCLYGPSSLPAGPHGPLPRHPECCANATGYEVPAGRKVDVEIQDADQKPVYQKTLTTSSEWCDSRRADAGQRQPRWATISSRSRPAKTS
jgi:hypothetical protein